MKKILIVDDSTTIITLLSYMLIDYFGKGEIEIIQAKDGAEALFALEDSDIELVFLDIMMPVIDGTSVAKYIENRKLDLQTIIITANLDKEIITSLGKIGFKNFLPKPIHTDRLETILQKIGL